MYHSWAPYQHCELRLYIIDNQEKYHRASYLGNSASEYLASVFDEPERARDAWLKNGGKNEVWVESFVELVSNGEVLTKDLGFVDDVECFLGPIVKIVSGYLEAGFGTEELYDRERQVTLSNANSGAAVLDFDFGCKYFIHPPSFLLDMLDAICRYYRWRSQWLGEDQGQAIVYLEDLMIKVKALERDYI